MPKRDPVLAALGQNVRRRRGARELTQEKLAEKAGLDPDAPEKYTLTDHLWNYLQNAAKKHQAAGNGSGFGLVTGNDITRTLSARYHKDGSEILISQGSRKNPRRLTTCGTSFDALRGKSNLGAPHRRATAMALQRRLRSCQRRPVVATPPSSAEKAPDASCRRR
jgi:hypothetical protein